MIFGSKVYRTHTVENSMRWAREHIASAPDGAIFLADKFITAQGRQGRVWEVKEGQLLITVILKPLLLSLCSGDEIGIRLNQLSIALSLGILQPLLVHQVTLKWPNDFYLQDKKMGGMLMQPIWQGETLQGIILGFGLNINTLFSEEEELYDIATSIAMISGNKTELRSLYFALLRSLDTYYLRWQEGDYQSLYAEWRRHQSFIGKDLIVHQPDGSYFRAALKQVMPNGDAIMSSASNPFQQIPFHLVEHITLETKKTAPPVKKIDEKKL